MMQKAHDTVRKTVEITTELEKTIQDIADKKFWSFSQTCSVLLQQAVKEKTRKKVAATKEVHT